MTSEPNAFCSVAEATALLPVKMVTVRRWIKSGVLPHVQPGGKGGRILIPIAGLDPQKLLKIHRAASKAETSLGTDSNSTINKSDHTNKPAPESGVSHQSVVSWEAKPALSGCQPKWLASFGQRERI
jgi:excisionase family DNA binding protein